MGAGGRGVALCATVDPTGVGSGIDGGVGSGMGGGVGSGIGGGVGSGMRTGPGSGTAGGAGSGCVSNLMNLRLPRRAQA